jgi:hypothetical protein
MINEILASFPLSVIASISDTPSGNNDKQLTTLAFDYQDILLNCHFVPGKGGWTIVAAGDKDTLELRDSGELHSGNNGLMIKPDRQVMLNSLRTCVEDFIQSVRDRREPESNSMEGLMQIIINLAVERAITNGGRIDLIRTPRFYDSGKIRMLEKGYET